MTVERIKNGGALTLAIEGRMDSLSSPELEEIINTELDGVNELTLDFSGVDYISSAGLRVLLCALKKPEVGGNMRVKNVCPTVSEIFEITGFNEILTVE